MKTTMILALLFSLNAQAATLSLSKKVASHKGLKSYLTKLLKTKCQEMTSDEPSHIEFIQSETIKIGDQSQPDFALVLTGTLSEDYGHYNTNFTMTIEESWYYSHKTKKNEVSYSFMKVTPSYLCQ